MKVLLVGTGYMAKEYAKILRDLEIDYYVVGRSSDNAKSFSTEFGVKVEYGGLLEYCRINDLAEYSHAINCSSMETLTATSIALLQNGIKNLLIEKPGVSTSNDISSLIREASLRPDTNVVIGYNRRFYASVMKAKEIIKADGGVKSFLFEFTEWGHVIETYDFDDKILNNWFLGNSTHVIDTAFYLSGKPKELCCFRNQDLDWHPA